jgi:hypothetical protein
MQFAQVVIIAAKLVFEAKLSGQRPRLDVL